MEVVVGRVVVMVVISVVGVVTQKSWRSMSALYSALLKQRTSALSFPRKVHRFTSSRQRFEAAATRLKFILFSIAADAHSTHNASLNVDVIHSLQISNAD